MNKVARWMLLACLLSQVAVAVETPGLDPTVAVGGLVEFPDGARHSDNGYGGFGDFYLPVPSRPGEGLDLDVYGLKRDRDSGGSDSQIGLFANYVKNFGLYGWEPADGAISHLPSFSPYVLAGGGAIREYVDDRDHYVPGIDAGLGLAFPLGWHGISLRTDARVISQYNDRKSVSHDDFLFDWQLRIGLSIPLGHAARAVADVAPAKECGVAVVDPVTGRSDCTVDSDQDGVPDNADLCPGTVAGTPVDLNGCPVVAAADSDGDGVPDTLDACPNTPSGTTVDARGCTVPLPDQEPASTGKVTLTDVRFAKNSADLTSEAKHLLDQAAVGLASDSEVVVEVAGHTDSEGKANYNLMLSLLRADTVRQYLVSKGVSRYRLFVEGYGETRPVAANSTEQGRAKNRRVDLDKLDVKVVPQ